MMTKNTSHSPSPRGKGDRPHIAVDEGYASTASSVRQQTDKLQFEFYHIIIPHFPQEIKCHRVKSTTGLLFRSSKGENPKKSCIFAPFVV